MTILLPYERKLVEATQAGLPLDPQPYARVAEQTGLTEAGVIAGLGRLMERGIIRRIAAAPNHYALGMTANGMTVWDVNDDRISDLGQRIGALAFVSHCYRRPRALPLWPYNLFAMVHGANRDEVESKRREIAALLGDDCRGSDILYSKRILKKTGLRLSASGG
ncbi:MAG: Lrp/AsnC family transcriptional regulator [Hyphomicrobium sp.]|jgi:DNA-binding Lrp family transcriptional regulator|nr:Lrp/AsnC family transcriptional regulator [Hyphomicrobium sp.]